MSTSNVLSFVEESCFSGDQFKSVRREVIFTVNGFGNNLGRPIQSDFSADFGLWYDYEDKYLVEILEDSFPDIRWGWFVFHKKMDHSSIQILHPETTAVVGSIHVRRGSNQKLSGEILGGNVMSWASVQLWKEQRDERRAKQLENQVGG